MAPATDEDQKRLFEGLDYLGAETRIGQTGTSDVAAGSTGLPAPSAPGGMAGFAGGAGAPAGGEVTGAGPGMPDIAGLIQKILGKAGQGEGGGDLGTRGSVGGDDQTQTADQSLSDRLRSGDLGLSSLGGINPLAGYSGQTSGASVTGQLADLLSGPGGSVTEQLRDLGAFGPGGAGPAGVDASGASGAGALAGMAIGPLLQYLGSLATKDSSPEMQAAIQGLTTALAPAVAPATAGAVSGAVAGTGALSGAAGGLAAAGPGLIASAPMAAMIIATSINNMLTQQAMAGKLEDRFKNLQQNLPGHIAAMQQAPGLLAQLGPDTTPDQAAAIYQQLEKIQTDFDSSGMEDFLQKGQTSVTGPSGMGSLEASFPGGPEIMKQLEPFGVALDMARIRASDIAARGGKPIPGARPLHDYAFTLGSPAFTEMARPSMTTPGSGQVSEQLGKIYGPQAGYQAEAAGSTTGTFDPTAEAGQLATPQLLAFAGLPADSQVTVGDLERFLAPGGAGYGRVEQGNAAATYLPTHYGIANREIFDAIGAIQPGNYEQGLVGLYGKYGGMNPAFEQAGFGGGIRPQSEIGRQISGALGQPGGAGTGLAEGMLSEEERKRLGQ